MTRTRNGTKVFIAGSRHLARLSNGVKRRIENIVDKGLTVIVGDANGIDKAVQQYLNGRHYRNVVVFCMEGGCRNNVGGWPTRMIKAADPKRKDFTYYSTKDRAMAEEADYGLMLWDGESRGTLTDVIDLVRKSKPVVVYLAPQRTFYTLRQASDLAAMLHGYDPVALHRIDHGLQNLAMSSHSIHKADSALLF